MLCACHGSKCLSWVILFNWLRKTWRQYDFYQTLVNRCRNERQSPQHIPSHTMTRWLGCVWPALSLSHAQHLPHSSSLCRSPMKKAMGKEGREKEWGNGENTCEGLSILQTSWMAGESGHDVQMQTGKICTRTGDPFKRPKIRSHSLSQGCSTTRTLENGFLVTKYSQTSS